MNTEAVNILLIKYDGLINKKIKEVNIPKSLMKSRCIDFNDIKQEILIKLWHLLENEYKSEYDLENFISFQTSLHTRWFLTNLNISSRSFTGSKHKSKKSGSKQAIIDNHKISINKFMDVRDREATEHDGSSPPIVPKELINNDFENFGEAADSYWIIDETIKRLNKIDDNKFITNDIKSRRDYGEIFMFMILNIHYFNETNISSILSQKFGYKSIAGMNNIVNRIKEVFVGVLKDYNS